VTIPDNLKAAGRVVFFLWSPISPKTDLLKRILVCVALCFIFFVVRIRLNNGVCFLLGTLMHR